MCPRFFGIFRSSCFVSIRYNPHRRWQTNQVEDKLALKAGCGLVAPSLDHSTFHRAWGVSCCATAQPAELPHSHEDRPTMARRMSLLFALDFKKGRRTRLQIRDKVRRLLFDFCSRVRGQPDRGHVRLGSSELATPYRS